MTKTRGPRVGSPFSLWEVDMGEWEVQGEWGKKKVNFKGEGKKKKTFLLFEAMFVKAAALRINLNLDGAPIASKSHTHPSHSQTSCLLTSSLSLGVPVPRPTQCMRDT
jgi:hypothetical protein